MVEDLKLDVHLLLFLLDAPHDLLVVPVVELFELAVLDEAVLIRVDLLEEAEEILSLERDTIDLWHHGLHVAHCQEAHSPVHATEGILGCGDHLQLLLNGAEHLSTLYLLRQAHILLLSGSSGARHCPTASRGLSLLVLEHIVICVCSPELLQELLLADVALLVFIESGQENLQLLVREVSNLEADQGLPHLVQGYGGRVVFVYEVEALVDCDVVLSQVLSNLPEDASLPLDGELFLYRISIL